MTTDQVLLEICDFNHNYRGCSDMTDSFLLVDRVTTVIYSALFVYSICKLWIRRIYKFDTTNVFLSVTLVSLAFRIAHVLTVGISFPAAVFLHYFYMVFNQMAISLAALGPSSEENSKRHKVEEALVTTRSAKLWKFFIYSVNPFWMMTVAFANITTVFLLALDSSDIGKFYIYHFIQYVGNPLYILFFAVPIIARSIFHKVVIKKTNAVLSGETNDFLIPEILTAVKDIQFVSKYSLFVFFTASFAMIMDVVGIYFDSKQIFIVKILAESSLVITNFTMVQFFADDVSNAEERKKSHRTKTTQDQSSSQPEPVVLKMVKISNSGTTQEKATVILPN
jgi:hypothetical protein